MVNIKQFKNKTIPGTRKKNLNFFPVFFIEYLQKFSLEIQTLCYYKN